jgi:hypothetical protein
MNSIANFFFYGIGAVLVIVGIAAIVQIFRNRATGANVVRRAANWARNKRLSPEEALRVQVKEAVQEYREAQKYFGQATRELSAFYPRSVEKTNDLLNDVFGQIEGHVKWHVTNETPEDPCKTESESAAKPLWEEE